MTPLLIPEFFAAIVPRTRCAQDRCSPISGARHCREGQACDPGRRLVDSACPALIREGRPSERQTIVAFDGPPPNPMVVAAPAAKVRARQEGRRFKTLADHAKKSQLANQNPPNAPAKSYREPRRPAAS